MATIHVHLHHDYPDSLDRKLDHIMADLTGLQTAVADVSREVAEAIAALADLAAKVAAGTVQQSDIDAITQTLTGAASSLDEATGVDPIEPPVEPTP